MATSGRIESLIEWISVPWVMALKRTVSASDVPAEGSANSTTSGANGAWRSMYSLR